MGPPQGSRARAPYVSGVICAEVSGHALGAGDALTALPASARHASEGRALRYGVAVGDVKKILDLPRENPHNS